MLDRYMIGTVQRISPEAPVPVVELLKEEERLGGAANVALNIISLGAEVVLASVVGNDNYWILKLFIHILDKKSSRKYINKDRK